MVSNIKKTASILAPMSNMESAEYAASQIRSAIIQGGFKPGERLIEKQLTDQLGISRHPVREALRLLSREGLVEMRVNRGAIVAELKVEMILEVYSLRSALGKLALKALLSGHATPAPGTLKHLEGMANKALKLARQADQAASVANDLAFQQAIVEASGLERCERYFAELTAEIHRFNNLSRIAYTDRESDATNYVLALYEAIKAADLPRAEHIWQAKFDRAVERYLAHVGAGETGQEAPPVLTR
ncbi:GntR family transcriptional regulator [Pseudomonas sp. RIT-PI-S]|uniref:GntR family transcriptional regulator n=1 Tax=Pseudomonas sp. RIT-PI-S TaxID=3035295 RepID=UPI0021D84538|nr:GntR family transcriptional regulator [Pseudomonas sp. RIT-PI-S]